MNDLLEILNLHQPYNPIIPFDQSNEKLLLLNLTEQNKELNQDIFTSTENFSEYVNSKLQHSNSKYAIGGYTENRIVYSRSVLFSSTTGSNQEAPPRSLHLGIDIWGNAGTSVYAPMEATVHSFSYNDGFGNYGATLILQHKIEDIIFHTLYGHLSLKSIEDKKEDQKVEKGEWIASFGEPHENGNWPPHLHFQIIQDMEGKKGDYPGVCALSEKENYLANCPDPDLILQMLQFVQKN